ncbi:Glycosyltransferase involved in cell wall bisynthesis [Butyrivibrio hungatei DSM 14810]|uniref:Glycosyl transferase GT2 family n=2 Tax=Butyrivibrio hungatei TaxID=185008 RepID=A0A1D9NYT4_9FIRM|nr:glycosyltransferase family 2 protein [Butyrivibrio hungatei]AOZ95488.1 glycosyl transferase GT2 family [Butyrivibrio hungatei]SHN65856.1 Glycosyltransferase involved in cell wall bisynthesis [Butyrivibrio hungatei DSM 14810]
MNYSISVVVPVFNEEGNIANLHKEIKDVCEKNEYDYEIIFVNDGSSDGTDKVCRTLRPLKYIKMRKNFGQTAAMDAGIKAATKDLIVTMDGDGQNDPADIPNMIKYMEDNDVDVVSGWRKNRKDTFMKRFVSRGANLLRYMLVHDGIHDSGCSLKVYKKECFKGVNLYGEQHRFIPAILKIKGFTVGEVVVNHRARTSGYTKYNWKRTIKGFVDMISVWFWNKFATRPLHLLGGLGLLFELLGFGCGIWSIVLFAMGRKMSNNIFPPLLTIFFVIIGLIMIVFGLMSEILIKTYYGVHVDTSYSIKSIETFDGNDSNEKEA